MTDKAKKPQFYVYALIDSRNDEIFYIGKGTGKRMYHHVRNWKSLSIPSNHKKYDRLCEIFDNQGEVKYKVLHRTDDEDEVYETEKKTIKSIGKKNLTNIHHGGRIKYIPQDEKNRTKALKLLLRLKPNDGTRSKSYPVIRECLTSCLATFGYIVKENKDGCLIPIKIGS